MDLSNLTVVVAEPEPRRLTFISHLSFQHDKVLVLDWIAIFSYIHNFIFSRFLKCFMQISKPYMLCAVDLHMRPRSSSFGCVKFHLNWKKRIP